MQYLCTKNPTFIYVQGLFTNKYWLFLKSPSFGEFPVSSLRMVHGHLRACRHRFWTDLAELKNREKNEIGVFRFWKCRHVVLILGYAYLRANSVRKQTVWYNGTSGFGTRAISKCTHAQFWPRVHLKRTNFVTIQGQPAKVKPTFIDKTWNKLVCKHKSTGTVLS